MPLDLGLLDVIAAQAEAATNAPIMANQEREAAILAERDGRFSAISLKAWLAYAAAAGLAHVPSLIVAEIPVEPLLRFDCPEPGDERAAELLREGLSCVAAGEMVRWDTCAGIELKAAMDRLSGDSSDWVAASRIVGPSDPRFFEILFDYAGTSIPLHARPWVSARLHEGRPVEYRVFIKDSKVLGISNYYPQRCLPDDDQVRRELAVCRQMAETLIEHLQRAGAQPWMGRYNGHFDPSLIHCTLDFLVDHKGEALFLEAGPAFGAGAHPCCFAARGQVDGVALCP